MDNLIQQLSVLGDTALTAFIIHESKGIIIFLIIAYGIRTAWKRFVKWYEEEL
jgi:hypothetical protein